jgi:BTB/POZ domain
VYEVIYKNMKESEEEDKIRKDKVECNMKLNLRGKLFDTSKEVLVKAGCTYFSLLISSPFFELDCEGAYFIDRTSIGFDRILEYMNTGSLSVEGLNKYDVDCMYDNLDYFKIPHIAQIDYSRGSSVEGLRMDVLLQLRDGRLLGRTNDGSIHIWSMDTNMIEISLKGQTGRVDDITELASGSLSIRSYSSWIDGISNSKTYRLSLKGDGRVSQETADKTTHFHHHYADWPTDIMLLALFLFIVTPVSIGLLYINILLLSIPLCPSPRPPPPAADHKYIMYLSSCMDSYLSRWITRG